MSPSTRRSLPLLVAAAVLAFAAPASASSWHRKHHDHSRHYGGHSYEHGYKHHKKHHKHHYKHYKHYRKHHGHHGGHGYYVSRHSYGYPVYHHAPAAFYHCGPCGHHFDSYDALHSHVHHHHHVPLIHLPFVIVHATLDATLGWAFHGY